MFRPTFETLEEREVFSAGPLDLPVDVRSFSLNFAEIDMESKAGAAVVGSDHAWGSSVSLQWGTGRGLVGDFNGDGRDDVAGIAMDGMGVLPLLLPYIEQDNLYKSWSPFADFHANAYLMHPSWFDYLATPAGGEVISDAHHAGPSDGRDASNAGCGLMVDFLELSAVESDSDAAHDLAFSPQQPGTEGYLAWDDPRQQQIIAILIGLVASRSEDSEFASKDADRIADITDRTSNTFILVSRPTAGALDLNDLFI